MTTQAQAATVRQEIAVDAPVDRAFRVFTEQMDRIKPREHNMLGVDIAETVFEPRAGGRIYDRGTDGSECEWASVIAFEPPDRLVFSWNVSPRWQVETDPRGAAKSRCGSSPRAPTAHASSSSIATSTATATAGRACATASRRPTAGRSTCSATPIS